MFDLFGEVILHGECVVMNLCQDVFHLVDMIIIESSDARDACLNMCDASRHALCEDRIVDAVILIELQDARKDVWRDVANHVKELLDIRRIISKMGGKDSLRHLCQCEYFLEERVRHAELSLNGFLLCQNIK